MQDGVMSITDRHSIKSPETISYGMDCIRELTAFTQENEVSRALLVTDEDIVRAGVTDPVEQALADADVEVDVFDEVKPEPKLGMAVDAADVASGGHDLIVGLGGGSSMDTAKLASVLADYDVPVHDVLGMGNIPGRDRFLALIPTTFGTGSEATHIGVFADKSDGNNKKVVYSEHLFADLALVDPSLTASLPPNVAAATGMDALTHAIEAYVTLRRTPYSDVIARQATELIGDNLRSGVHQGPDNDQARYNMCFAATLGGQAFMNSGLGAVHALTYPLGVEHSVGHGLANAVLLPHVMEYNVPSEPERYAEIARLLGAQRATDDTVLDLAYKGVKAVKTLNNDIGIPNQIRELGHVKKSEFDQFAEIAFEFSKHNIERNPREMTKEDVVSVFENAY